MSERNLVRMFSLALISSSLLLSACGQPAPPVVAVTKVPVQEPEQEKGGFSKKMADLVDKAKAKLPSIDETKKMLGDAGDATGETADETKQWVEETFKALSEIAFTFPKPRPGQSSL